MARRTRHQVLALLPITALALTVAGCTSTAGNGAGGDNTTVKLAQAGKLLTCTSLPYEPFQFQKDGKIVGFDVDLIDLVAKELGVTQEVKDTPFEGIQSGTDLNSNKCDVAAAGMTITDVRKQNFDFSDGYFVATQVLFAKKGSGVKDFPSLKGKVLGVQNKTTGQELAEKQAEGVEKKVYEDLGTQLIAVQSGQVPAGINDDFVIKDFIAKNPDFEITADMKTNENYGFGVRKGNEALRAKINEVIKKIKGDGSYDTIFEKWFKRKPGQ